MMMVPVSAAAAAAVVRPVAVESAFAPSSSSTRGRKFSGS